MVRSDGMERRLPDQDPAKKSGAGEGEGRAIITVFRGGEAPGRRVEETMEFDGGEMGTFWDVGKV